MSDKLYRLRPERAWHNPAFRLDELYQLLERTHPEGYVFLELHRKPRCVWVADFELAEGSAREAMGQRTESSTESPVRPSENRR
jgi:hypothetical protein